MDKTTGRHSYFGFMDTEKNWLSTPLYIRKYHHLWNLLNRSCIYASTLLALIEAKQAKRKRRLAKLEKRRAKAKKLHVPVSEIDEVERVVESLLHELVEQVRMDVEIFDNNRIENELEASMVTISDDFSTEPNGKTDNTGILNVSNESNSSNADSALGESGIVSERFSFSFEDECVVIDGSCDAAEDSAFRFDDTSELSSDKENNLPDAGNDQDYINSLNRRRGVCTLPSQVTNESENIDIAAMRKVKNQKEKLNGTSFNLKSLKTQGEHNHSSSQDSHRQKIDNDISLITSFEQKIDDNASLVTSFEIKTNATAESQIADIAEEMNQTVLALCIDQPADDAMSGLSLLPGSVTSYKVSKCLEDFEIYSEQTCKESQTNSTLETQSASKSKTDPDSPQAMNIVLPTSNLSLLSKTEENFKISQNTNDCAAEIRKSCFDECLDLFESTNFFLGNDCVQINDLNTEQTEHEISFVDLWDVSGGDMSKSPSNLDKVLSINIKHETAFHELCGENVACPICNRMISVKTINKHLDICSGVKTKMQSLRNRSQETEERHFEKIFGGKHEKPKVSKLIKPATNSFNEIEKPAAVASKKQENTSKSEIRTGDDKEENHSGKSVQPEILPTGVGALKAALNNAIASSNLVKDIVVQTAAAEQIASDKNKKSLEKDVLSKSPISQLQNQALSQKSPIIKAASPSIKSPFKVKIGQKRKSCDESCLNDFEGESSDEEECIIPDEPTRRSSRSTRSRKSYREISSDEDYVEEEFGPTRKEPPKKKKVHHRAESDSTMKIKADAASNLKKTNTSGSIDEEYVAEEECDGEMTEAEIDALLEKKYYKAGIIDTKHITTDENGFRYFHGAPIDPAQPKFFTGGVLREYQITGYQWLKLLHENGESGILADEMGLGKTIQCIALMCKLFKAGVRGPFLVCGPTSTINNWMSEFKKFAPKISLLLYHGSGSERRFLWNVFTDEINKKQQLVMVTSYEILLRDNDALAAYTWGYMILDEGHRVKNLKSKTFAQLKSFPASCKLMLTGTPLQNNVSELWSLLHFIFPEVFDDVQVFEAWFGIESLQKNEKLLSMLHQILTPFVLRRVKSDVEVKIPPKREVLVNAPLGSLQEKYYRATVDKSIAQLCKNKEYYNVTPGVADPDQMWWVTQNDGSEVGPCTRSKNTAGSVPEKGDECDSVINITLNNMMMQLRRCCNHPYLIQHPLYPGTNELVVDETLVSTCGKMMLLDRMLPLLKEKGHKVLLFSQMTSMLDLLEDYCNLRKFEFVRFDGSTRCEDRCVYIKEFNENPEIFIFLLSTRAGGLGINLTAADTVIIYDSDWNPQNDIQAQDRCHRIGQERPVVTYRLVSMSTIDQQIVERAAMKRKLEKIVMHQEKFKGNLASELGSTETVTTAELLNLLEATANISVVDNKENVISDADLYQLLDRSDMTSNKASASSSHNSQSQSNSTFQIIEQTEEERICA